MGYFSKYRPYYSIPERISPENARLNRINAALAENLRLQERYDRLSLDVKNTANAGRRLNQARQQFGPKADLMAAALASFSEKDFADPANRIAYRKLRAQQAGRQQSKPSGADKRQFNPTGYDFASTLYGGFATIGKRLTLKSALPRFHMSYSVIPCIERHVRREVMFAKKKAGRGYRTPKRRTWASGVPC